MSYEGHYQNICENGHFFTSAENYDRREPARCDACGGHAAWSNAVDDTNCDSFGEIPQKYIDLLYLVTPATYETCNLGHKHRVTEAIYTIPQLEDTTPLRHHRPSYGGTPLKPVDKIAFARAKSKHNLPKL